MSLMKLTSQLTGQLLKHALLNAKAKMAEVTRHGILDR